MTYSEFLTEFDDVIQAYGAENFPNVILTRAHLKAQDLNKIQLKELCELILDNCKFAPKVPDVIEYANLVRARHREGERQEFPRDEGPRTMPPDNVRELINKAFRK